jgi:hypothetical protein
MRLSIVPGLMALAAAGLYGLPPTTGAQYWSTNSTLDCNAIHSLIYEVSLASGGKGYACGITGIFPWLAAGGKWNTSIRLAAPASGAVGVQYVFFDGDGNPLSLDTASDSVPAPGSTVGMALNANQPSEVRLLGASSAAPQYNTTQTGSVFALFLCPDAATCAGVVPQLLFSFLPIKPWSLSAPIAWEASFSLLQPRGVGTRWSAAGIQDATHLLSFVIYNQSAKATTYTARVYDSNGSLAGQATIPAIPGFNAVDGVFGTRGFLLTDVIKTPLPPGILKVTVEAGSAAFSALFLQFSGDSAASLQASYDLSPASGSIGTPVLPSAVERARP